MQLVQISSLFKAFTGAPAAKPQSMGGSYSPRQTEVANIGISNLNKDGSWALNHVHMKAQSRGKDPGSFRIEKHDILLPSIGSLLRDENSAIAFRADSTLLDQFEPNEPIDIDRYILLLRFTDLHRHESDEALNEVSTLMRHFLNLPNTRNAILSKCCRGSIQPVLSKKEFLEFKVPNFFQFNKLERQDLLQLMEARCQIQTMAESVQTHIDDFLESITLS